MLPHLANHIRHVIFNALEKRPQLRRAALDAAKILLPLPRHDRALDFGVHHLDQTDALIRGFQHLAVAQNVLALQQHFDDGRARGRRPQTGLLHGVGEFLFVERFARRLHRREQRAFREPLGRPRLLLQHRDIHHVLRLVFGERCRQRLFGWLIRLALFGFRRRRQVQHLPAHLHHRASRRVIPVDDPGIADRRDHRRHRPDVVLVPGAQQPPANQIVNLMLVRRQRNPLGPRRCRNDRVMVADLGIVHEAPSQRPFTSARSQVLAVRFLNRLDDAGQRARHILRQMPAIGARIADQFVAFIQRLRHVQRLLRAEPEKPVGVPLQFRKIVQRRRRHALGLGFDGFDGRLPGTRPRRDAVGLFAIGRQAHGLLQRFLIRRPFSKPGSLISAVLRRALRVKRGHHLDVVFHHEFANRQFAFHHHGQRRRLYPAHRQIFFAVCQRIGARKIHAHQPVSPAPSARRVRQRIVLAAGPQRFETFTDGVRRER